MTEYDHDLRQAYLRDILTFKTGFFVGFERKDEVKNNQPIKNKKY